jgi:hypothetical protein
MSRGTLRYLGFDVPGTYNVPVTTRVLAVEARLLERHSYIIGSLSDNYTATHESWKCIQQGSWENVKWTEVSFNDTSVSNNNNNNKYQKKIKFFIFIIENGG